MTLPVKDQEAVVEELRDRVQEIEAAVATLLAHVEPQPKTLRPSRWVTSADETTAPDSLY